MTSIKEDVPTRFESFMKGFATAVQLSKRTVESGSFIESVCLSASIIDALLRMGLILNYQLKNKTDKILEELLYQSNEKKIVTEREIYKRALNEKIITTNIYQKLNELYFERNKVVHQYIISDITTDKVLTIAIKYTDLVHIVNDSVRKLEDEQIRLGLGMTKSDDGQPGSFQNKLEEFLYSSAIDKHGNSNLAKNLKVNKKNS